MKAYKALRQGLAGLAVIACLAGAKPVLAQEAPKESKVTLEDTVSESGNQKLRLTLEGDTYTVRLDRNKQSGHFLADWAAYKSQAGNIHLIHVASPEVLSLGSAACLKTTAVLVKGKYIVTAGDIVTHKASLEVQTKTLDAAIQVAPEGEVHRAQYFVAVHSKKAYASLGRNYMGNAQWVFATTDSPSFSVIGWGDYDPRTHRATATLQNTFAKTDMGVYSLEMGRLGTDLLTLGAHPVLFPYFTTFQTYGTRTHELVLDIAPGQIRVANQVGAVIREGVSIGGGAEVSRAKGKTKIEPIVSGYFRLPVKGHQVYLEAKWQGKTFACYVTAPLK